jgi:RND superfamily putative drug exporter
MNVLESLAQFTYRARRPVIAFFAILFGSAALYGAGVADELSVGGFEDPGSESAHAKLRLEEVFDAGHPDIVVAYTHETATFRDPPFRSILEPLLERVEATGQVEEIGSPYGAIPKALPSSDGRTVIVTMKLRGEGKDARAAYAAIESLLRPEGLETLVGGVIPASNEAQRAAAADLRRAEMVTLPLLAVLLVVFFRGVVVASLPLLIGGFAVSAALAMIRLATHFTDVSIFAMNIVTFVGLGVAVDYALFMASRFRDELHAGVSVERAVQTTMATAGRTIAYSGFAVAASLLGMLAFPMTLLRSVAIAGSAVVMMALVATLVFLPAVLSALGHRIDLLSLGRSKTGPEQDNWHGPLKRLSDLAMRAPVLVTIGVTAFLLLLGAPFLHINESVSGAAVLPHEAEARQLDELISSDRFPPYAASPVEVFVHIEGDGLDGLERLDQYAQAIRDLPAVERVDSLGESDEYAFLRVATPARPESAEASELVATIRKLHTEGISAEVGGNAARLVDLRETMGANLPAAMAIVCAATFVVLFMAFGSVIMPLKAIVMNVLSLSASFGALVFIFQDGRFETLLDFRSPGSIELTVPVVMFAVVFGLAMDYELFLLSRIREAYDISGDTRESVATGLAHTGKLITRAALLLIAVVLGFVTADMLLVKELGVGMTIAIAIDATIVRIFLVPATMQLLGRYNWWAPAPLARLWRRSGLGVDERSPEEQRRAAEA